MAHTKNFNKNSVSVSVSMFTVYKKKNNPVGSNFCSKEEYNSILKKNPELNLFSENSIKFLLEQYYLSKDPDYRKGKKNIIKSDLIFFTENLSLLAYTKIEEDKLKIIISKLFDDFYSSHIILYLCDNSYTDYDEDEFESISDMYQITLEFFKSAFLFQFLGKFPDRLNMLPLYSEKKSGYKKKFKDDIKVGCNELIEEFYEMVRPSYYFLREQEISLRVYKNFSFILLSYNQFSLKNMDELVVYFLINLNLPPEEISRSGNKLQLLKKVTSYVTKKLIPSKKSKNKYNAYKK